MCTFCQLLKLRIRIPLLDGLGWNSHVLVSSSRFVLRLATVQALCNLARVVLELHRLDEICVPLEVSLSA